MHRHRDDGDHQEIDRRVGTTLTICDICKAVDKTMKISRPQPRVAIVTVGDELRMPGEKIERLVIDNSRTTRKAIREELASAIGESDVIITASGISTAREA